MATLNRRGPNRRRRIYEESTLKINEHHSSLEEYFTEIVNTTIVVLCLRFYATDFTVFNKMCIFQHIYMFSTIVVYWLVKRVSLQDKMTKWWIVLTLVVIFTRILPMCIWLNVAEDVLVLEKCLAVPILFIEAMTICRGYLLVELIEDRSRI